MSGLLERIIVALKSIPTKKGWTESVEHSIERKERLTFTDQLRVIFKWVLDPTAKFLHKLGIHPNTLTLTGLLGTTVGAVLISQGRITLGGVLILVMVPIDALDGPVARLRGEPEDFGAFVDSVSDRYAELVIFAGLLWYFLQQGDSIAGLLVFLAAAGSVMVSYVRARAQSVGLDAKVGILTRVERYLVLAPSLLFNIPLIGVGVVAVLANFTAIQRIIHVRRTSRARGK